MNDKLIIDNDFQMGPIVSDEIKPGFTQLHLPENLQGMNVLELFSGDEAASLQAEVLRRGGQYTSVDLFHTASDFHFHADATKELPFLPNSVDFILMAHPPIWEAETRLNIPVVKQILNACLPLLKPISGRFIGILTPMDDVNFSKLCEVLTQDPFYDDFTPFSQATSLPQMDSYGQKLPGVAHTFRLIRD